MADLVTRATNILTKPAVEWNAIASERTAPAELMIGYALPLTAISAIARFIGSSFVGLSLPFVGTYRVGIVRGVTGLIVNWILALVAAGVAAKVVEQLAPRFQSRGSFEQALKLVVYASTPAWIGGILGIFPALTPLMILFAIYAIYLFYLGLPRLMQTPDGQVIPYMLVAALVMIVISVIFGLINATIIGAR
jgi:hypothetical protein